MQKCWKCGRDAATVEVYAPSGYREAWCGECIGAETIRAWAFPLLVLAVVAGGVVLAFLAALAAVKGGAS